MDLGAILNADDRSKTSNQPYTRTLHNGHHGRNASNKIVGRPIASAIKHVNGSSKVSWAQENNFSKPASSSSSSNGRITTSRKPRINTSSHSLSESSRMRASAKSPGSYSCSSRSPPSPSTPSSTASIGRAFSSLSYGKEVLHKPVSVCGIRRSETSKPFPNNYHASQIHATSSMVSGISHANHNVNQSYPHLNRVLPLPVTRTPLTISTPLPSPIRHSIPPISPSTPSSRQTCPQPGSQRTCSATPDCDYSTPKRRIVSQFFGRNKKETRLIPRHCWIYYCRQHYQRVRYRLTPPRFAELQMNLVRTTVNALESESIVISWEVKLRKRVLEKLTKSSGNSSCWDSHKSSKKSSSSSSSSGSKSSSSSNGLAAGAVPGVSPGESREQLLLPLCGSGKSFKQVYEILKLVEEICKRDGGTALEFEILPTFTTEWVREEENRRRMSRSDGSFSGSDSSDDDC